MCSSVAVAMVIGTAASAGRSAVASCSGSFAMGWSAGPRGVAEGLLGRTEDALGSVSALCTMGPADNDWCQQLRRAMIIAS